MAPDRDVTQTPAVATEGRRGGGRAFELVLFAAAVVTVAAILFGGFGEAGSIHLASAFR